MGLGDNNELHALPGFFFNPDVVTEHMVELTYDERYNLVTLQPFDVKPFDRGSVEMDRYMREAGIPTHKYSGVQTPVYVKDHLLSYEPQVGSFPSIRKSLTTDAGASRDFFKLCASKDSTPTLDRLEREKHLARLKDFDKDFSYGRLDNETYVPDCEGGSISIRGYCSVEDLEAFLYFLRRDAGKTKAQVPEEVDPDTGPWLIRSLNEFQRLVERVRERHSQEGHKIPHMTYIEAIPGYVKADVHYSPSGSVEKLVFYTVHDVHACTPEQVNATRLKQKDQQ